jgi:hypothetical protein
MAAGRLLCSSAPAGDEGKKQAVARDFKREGG